MYKNIDIKLGIKKNLAQIVAIVRKDLKLNIRPKTHFIVNLITPLISIIMPLIILRRFFELNANFGPWNATNYLVFQFLAYNILLLNKLITEFPNQFGREKYWKTLPALIIAPFNRFALLLGVLFGGLITISIPFVFFLILCYIYYPISILTLLLVIFIFFIIAVIFCGIGLIMASYMISKEEFYYVFNFLLIFVIWLSCITYPFELFPNEIQMIIELNPLYYILDIVKLAWIEDNVIQTVINHPINFIILFSLAIIFPIIGVLIFNRIYKKYGIVGY